MGRGGDVDRRLGGKHNNGLEAGTRDGLLGAEASRMGGSVVDGARHGAAAASEGAQKQGWGWEASPDPSGRAGDLTSESAAQDEEQSGAMLGDHEAWARPPRPEGPAAEGEGGVGLPS
jgi:hypothetical protein